MKDDRMAQESSIEAALEMGASTLTRWTQDGTLIAPQQLARAWAQDSQALQVAVLRGDLFEVWVDKAPYCAAVFAALGAEMTAKVCQALGTQTASAKLVFLMRQHGALNTQTVLQALKSGTPIYRIEELANASVAGV
jgi:hypothetical protein